MRESNINAVEEDRIEKETAIIEQKEEDDRIDNVIEKFKNEEYISNEDFLSMCKKLSISIPLKTHGYIKSKLDRCNIAGTIYTYGKNTSQTIHAIIHQAREILFPNSDITDLENTCSNEDLDHFFGKEKGYHDKLEQDKKIKLNKTNLSHRNHMEYRTKITNGELIENNTISDGLLHVILKKYYNYNSYNLSGDRTVLDIYSRNMIYSCSILYNDYLSIIKECKSGNNGLVRDVYEIVRG